jgi:hypothetical protein
VDLSELQRFYHEQSGALKHLQVRHEQLEARQASLVAEQKAAAMAHELLQGMADKERLALQHKIESLVTFGLQAVFGSEYEFKLVQTVSRGLVNYDFELVCNGQTTVLKDAHGGGVLCVVGYLLRLIVVLLSGQRRLLVLDETFGMLSREYLPAIVELIREVTDKLGFQHIVVSHSPEFEENADLVYRVKLDAEGHSQVTRVLEYEG